MEENQIGNINSNKKARGLLRAGGEASRHVHIDWPHDFVLSGPDKDRICYKDLNLEQWAYGYTCILENQTNPVVKDNMIGHLKHFFHDTISYGFKRAKGAHAEVLSEMELGKFNWQDRHAISETRKTHTQRPMTWEEWLERQNENRRSDNKESTTDSYKHGNREYGNRQKYSSGGNRVNKKPQFRLCRNYNEAKCTFEGDHTQGSVIWRHACLGCKISGHRITECRRAPESSKN
jgi:hypothetical protein